MVTVDTQIYEEIVNFFSFFKYEGYIRTQIYFFSMRIFIDLSYPFVRASESTTQVFTITV